MSRHARVLLSIAVLWWTLACTLTSPQAAPSPVPSTAPPPTATSAPTTAPPTPTPTLTPTPTPSAAVVAPTDAPNRCVGLSGTLDIQILVGPSDAVGLSPEAVGSLPWTVTTDTAPYTIEGQTHVDYQDTLVREWGSFDVQMAMDFTADGTCQATADGGSLTMAVTMEGEQLVTVTSEGFTAEYPWEGTQTRAVTFPLEEGATAQGEGWAFILHLN